MVFSKPKKHAAVQIIVEDTCISPSEHCMYLGFTIDNRLTWKQHIQRICIAARKAFFSICHCFRRTRGLSHSKLKLFYKVVFLPILLYNCSVWAQASLNDSCAAAMFKSGQRPFLLSISKCLKSTASSAATVITNILPVDLKITEIVLKRSFAPSTSSLIPDSIISAFASLIVSVSQPSQAQVNKAVLEAITKRWDSN